MLEKVFKDSTVMPELICGIDTLFYFCETNENYDELFLDILDQLDINKGKFERMELSYSNNDIKITINNQLFEYNGKAQGFYWFTHLDEFVTIGFKDNYTNRALHNIQVQFNGVDIYTLGVKTLLKYVDDLFEKFVTGNKPITRVDLNVFIQFDLSWLKKDMFVSRKRVYTEHLKEISSKYRLQTLYIGKAPFKLRLYDKREELKKSKKRELMHEHFLNNGFSLEDDIFNIEFEMLRKHLKTFNIDTVDDLLGNAEKLFKNSMDAIRLIDLSTITEASKESYNRYKADTHPLWQYISDSYKLDEFLATDHPLERIKRKTYSYTIEDSIKDHLILARKYYIHGGVIDIKFYDEVLELFEKSITSKYPSDQKLLQMIKDQRAKEYIVNNPEIVYEDIPYESDQELLSQLTDILLDKYIFKIESSMAQPNANIDFFNTKLQDALIEKKSRIKTQIEFPF